jgi:hypothetical protein
MIAFAIRSTGIARSHRACHSLLALAVLASLIAAGMPATALAQGEDVRTFALSGGSLSLEAPAGWKRVQPRSGIVETEFSIPAEAGDEQAGRMTVMGAGGGVQANVDRWYGQFTQPDGSATKDKASTKTIKISGCTVTVVDVAGTYKDSPGGPFAGGRTVERPGYRMLAAIVEPEDKDKGSYFLKFYGPAKTVEKHADGFRKMVEGMVPAAK